MGSTLAESKNFVIMNEYEKVFLVFKNSNRKICIGDFYGDPQDAIISNNECFCVMVGCGLIIYYLHEPFEEYRYNVSTNQWEELFRENGKTWWIEDVKNVDESTILISVEEVDNENGGRYKLNVNSFELTRCI
jgi:hypothetical protein